MVLTLASGVTLPLVRIPGGEFSMGSSDFDLYRDPDEKPKHMVHLDEYLIGKYEVTVAQFRAFVKSTGYKNYYTDSDVLPAGKEVHPVIFVSWNDAVAFCQWASQVTRRTVRLPTEAEWEKAARGTDGRIYPWGNESPDSNRCNYNADVGYTTPVGRYSPSGDSPYGCVDMAGNVLEWLNDWYQKNYYLISPGSNPNGPTYGNNKVLRGSGWYRPAVYLRAACRFGRDPENRLGVIGFRCAVSPGT